MLYVWYVHLILIWPRLKVNCLISLFITHIMGGNHLICFEWMKYFCESSHSWLLFPKHPLFQSPIHDYETLSEDGRWLEISIIFVKKALHNFKTDELTWWNLICHVYKYCVCFFQGHLIIPKEGIENARVDPGGSK